MVVTFENISTVDGYVNVSVQSGRTVVLVSVYEGRRSQSAFHLTPAEAQQLADALVAGAEEVERHPMGQQTEER